MTSGNFVTCVAENILKSDLNRFIVSATKVEQLTLPDKLFGIVNLFTPGGPCPKLLTAVTYKNKEKQIAETFG